MEPKQFLPNPVGVRFSPAMLAALDRLARDDRRTRVDMIRVLIAREAERVLGPDWEWRFGRLLGEQE
jgi:predicted transcriptional regulator